MRDVLRMRQHAAQLAKIIERDFAIRFAKRRKLGGDPGVERKQFVSREVE